MVDSSPVYDLLHSGSNTPLVLIQVTPAWRNGNSVLKTATFRGGPRNAWGGGGLGSSKRQVRRKFQTDKQKTNKQTKTKNTVADLGGLGGGG